MYNSKHVKIVAKALKEFLSEGKTLKTEGEYSGSFPEKRACFVTLKSERGSLRGCIGTLKPMYRNLTTEIIRNAVSAATRDPRFNPVNIDELERLKISVEILSEVEEIDPDELPDPKKFGLIIEEPLTGRRGVLLPNIEGINTPEEQVAVIKRKAGILQNGLDGLKCYQFTTKKYE